MVIIMQDLFYFSNFVLLDLKCREKVTCTNRSNKVRRIDKIAQARYYREKLGEHSY